MVKGVKARKEEGAKERKVKRVKGCNPDKPECTRGEEDTSLTRSAASGLRFAHPRLCTCYPFGAMDYNS